MGLEEVSESALGCLFHTSHEYVPAPVPEACRRQVEPSFRQRIENSVRATCLLAFPFQLGRRSGERPFRIA